MPFSAPYGAPIGAQRAQSLIQAAVSEANKKGWAMNIAVVDSGVNLVAFLRMDGAQLASILISQHKARAAAKYRRPTKAFEDAIQKADSKYVVTLDDVIASRGGIPLIENGKIIGAIGCSGGSTGSQDEVVCGSSRGAGQQGRPVTWHLQERWPALLRALMRLGIAALGREGLGC